jgi:hypothetical protein
MSLTGDSLKLHSLTQSNTSMDLSIMKVAAAMKIALKRTRYLRRNNQVTSESIRLRKINNKILLVMIAMRN